MDCRNKRSKYPEVILLFPDEFISERFVPVEFIISISLPGTNPNTNLTELSESGLEGLKAESDFRLVNHTSNANVTLSNGTETIPAFVSYLYDFSRAFIDFQRMLVVTVVNDEYVVMFEYSAEPELFNEYLPQAQKIMQSFQMTNNDTTN